MPTEKELVEAWSHHVCMDPFCSGGCPERFPAIEAIRRMKAQVWEEGYTAGTQDESIIGVGKTDNPYKEEA